MPLNGNKRRWEGFNTFLTHYLCKDPIISEERGHRKVYEYANKVLTELDVITKDCSEAIAISGLMGLYDEPSLQLDYETTRDMIYDFGCYILQRTLTHEKLILKFREKVHYNNTLTRNCIQCCDVWTEYFKTFRLRMVWNDMVTLPLQSLLKLNNETKTIIEVVQDDAFSNEILSLVLCIIENIQRGLTIIPVAQSNEVKDIPAIAVPQKGYGFTVIRNKILRPLLEKVKIIMKDDFLRWYAPTTTRPILHHQTCINRSGLACQAFQNDTMGEEKNEKDDESSIASPASVVDGRLETPYIPGREYTPAEQQKIVRAVMEENIILNRVSNEELLSD